MFVLAFVALNNSISLSIYISIYLGYSYVFIVIGLKTMQIKTCSVKNCIFKAWSFDVFNLNNPILSSPEVESFSEIISCTAMHKLQLMHR